MWGASPFRPIAEMSAPKRLSSGSERSRRECIAMRCGAEMAAGAIASIIRFCAQNGSPLRLACCDDLRQRGPEWSEAVAGAGGRAGGARAGVDRRARDGGARHLTAAPFEIHAEHLHGQEHDRQLDRALGRALVGRRRLDALRPGRRPSAGSAAARGAKLLSEARCGCRSGLFASLESVTYPGKIGRMFDCHTRSRR